MLFKPFLASLFCLLFYFIFQKTNKVKLLYNNLLLSLVFFSLVSCGIDNISSNSSNTSELSGIKNNKYQLFLTHFESTDSKKFQFVTCDANVSQQDFEMCSSFDDPSASELPRCPAQNIVANHCVPAFVGDYKRDYCSQFEEFSNSCSRIAKIYSHNLEKCTRALYDPSHPDKEEKALCVNALSKHTDCQTRLPLVAKNCNSYLAYEQNSCSTTTSENAEICSSIDYSPEDKLPSIIYSPTIDPATKVAVNFHANYEHYLSQSQNNHSTVFNGIADGSFVSMLFGGGLPIIRQWGSGFLRKFVPKPNRLLNFAYTAVKFSAATTPHLIINEQPMFVKNISYSSLGACGTGDPKGEKTNPLLFTYPTFEDFNYTQTKTYGLSFGAGFLTNVGVIKATKHLPPSLRVGSMLALPFVFDLTYYLSGDRSSLDLPKYIDQIYQLEQTPSNDFTHARVNMGKLLEVLGRSNIVNEKTNDFEMTQYCLPEKVDGVYQAQCHDIFDGDEGISHRLKTNSLVVVPTTKPAFHQCYASIAHTYIKAMEFLPNRFPETFPHPQGQTTTDRRINLCKQLLLTSFHGIGKDNNPPEAEILVQKMCYHIVKEMDPASFGS